MSALSLRRELETAGNRLIEAPFTHIIERDAFHAEGLNAGEINRRLGEMNCPFDRLPFEKEEVKQDDEVREWWLIVRHPNPDKDSVRLLLRHRYLAVRLSEPALSRAAKHLAAWADWADNAGGGTKAQAALDTSPDCARPKQKLIDAAKANVPDLLSGMPNIEEGYNESPPSPDRLVSAEKVVQAIVANGHLEAAARHGIHELIQEGLLTGEPILRGVPTTYRHGSGKSGFAMMEDEAPKEAPVFDGPIPYSELLIRSTPSLWDSWRGKQTTPQQAGETVAGQTVFCSEQTGEAGADLPQEKSQKATELGAREKEILQALLLLNALGKRTRVSTRTAAHRAASGDKPSSFNHAISSLVKRGFVDSHTGQKGGIWLTSEGFAVATQLKS